MTSYSDDAAFARGTTTDPNGNIEYATFGLTKREYFAALALQGILANGISATILDRVKAAVDYADALIDALNKAPVQS